MGAIVDRFLKTQLKRQMFAYVVFTLSFAGPTGPVLSRSGRSSVLMIPSKCIPGLEAPPALDGTMVGDVGFDFLRISTTIVQLNGDLKYVREAEILHGRVAMLAAAGFVAPELFRFRTEWSPRALEAQFQVPVEVWGQIAFAIAIAEGLRSQFIFKSDMVPGEHGFDPLSLRTKLGGSTAEGYKRLQLSELKNGRLAMIAVSGMFAQQIITGKGPIEQLFN